MAVLYNIAFLPTFAIVLSPLLFLKAQYTDCFLRQWKLWAPPDPLKAHLILRIFSCQCTCGIQASPNQLKKFSLSRIPCEQSMLAEAVVIQNQHRALQQNLSNKIWKSLSILGNNVNCSFSLTVRNTRADFLYVKRWQALFLRNNKYVAVQEGTVEWLTAKYCKRKRSNISFYPTCKRVHAYGWNTQALTEKNESVA